MTSSEIIKRISRARGMRLPYVPYEDGDWPDEIADIYECPGCRAGQQDYSSGGDEGSDWHLNDDPLLSYSAFRCGGGWRVIQDEDGKYWWSGRCGAPLTQQLLKLEEA